MFFVTVLDVPAVRECTTDCPFASTGQILFIDPVLEHRPTDALRIGPLFFVGLAAFETRPASLHPLLAAIPRQMRCHSPRYRKATHAHREAVQYCCKRWVVRRSRALSRREQGFESPRGRHRIRRNPPASAIRHRDISTKASRGPAKPRDRKLGGTPAYRRPTSNS
jgi:hypothetical protein